MRRMMWPSCLLTGLVLAASAVAAPAGGIRGVVAAGVEPELVSEAFLNTEGPLGSADGGVYFSDTNGNRTYRIDPDGKITIFREFTNRGNGIAFTRDGKTLIVDNTIGNDVFAYDVQPDGSVKNKRVFAKLHDIKPGEESTADGMGLDRDGRLYVTTVRGIQVFDAKGGYLGTITVPRQPSNVAFSGPDKKTLYISARQGLYRLKMLSQGPDRLGK